MNAFVPGALLSLIVACGLACPAALSAGQVDALETPAANTTDTNAQLLRNFLILQDQLRATQRAVEQAREEALADSRRNTEIMAARMNLIEQTLDAQRQQQIESLQRTTRTTLTVVGIITGVGFLAVLLGGVMQVRAMTRLADVSRQFQALLPAPRTGGLPALLGGPEAVESGTSNLLGAIDRLQKRLEDMETATTATPSATNGHKPLAVPGAGNARVTAMLAKGQACLNANQPEDALDQFEQALHLDPKNVEALIKKGSALERLQRIDAAIAAYDEAIVVDNSQATAYLFKAGVYNRQKKYAEALQCYEKALSVQQKSRGMQAARG